MERRGEIVLQHELLSLLSLGVWTTKGTKPIIMEPHNSILELHNSINVGDQQLNHGSL